MFLEVGVRFEVKISPNFLKAWLEPWKEYVSEYIGVGLLVFLVSCSLVSQEVFGEVNLLVTSLAIGLSYTCILYSTNHISGGFLNPAVVISLWLVKRLSGFKAVFYLASQLMGSITGASLVYVVFGQRAVAASYGAPSLGLGIEVDSALVLEFFLSALFVFLTFGINVNKNAPNVFGPLVFGLFLIVATVIAWPATGASVNFARTLGPIVMSGDYSNLLTYAGGGLAGSLMGVGYEYLFLRRTKR